MVEKPMLRIKDYKTPRRNFLKLALLAGVAMAVGANGLAPAFASRVSATTPLQTELKQQTQGKELTFSKEVEPFVVVFNNGKLVAFQGQREFPINDNAFVAEFTTKLKSRMG